jgi:hypothetical protein
VTAGPPPALRCTVLPNGLAIRSPIGRAIVLLLVAAASLAGSASVPRDGWKDLATAATFLGTGLLFAYLGAMSLWVPTTLTYSRGTFVCQTLGGVRLEHLVSDIEGFIVAGDAAAGFRVQLVTHARVVMNLPLALDGIPLSRPGSAPIGVAPVEHARFVADWLNEALDAARREAVGYRVTGVGPRIAGDDASADVSAPAERDTRQRR